MPKILTIDLGTTFFKFALFDRDGRLCGLHRAEPPLVARDPARKEITAESFCATIAAGIAELRRRDDAELADLEAVTFATQTNSFLLLDAAGRPLTPIILWPDARAKPLEEELRERCGLSNFSATTGVPQVTWQFMLGKLLWQRRHDTEAWRRMRRVCLISDYLTLLFTGRHVTEAGAAGLTGLVDVHRCGWWPEMLAAFELDVACLPQIVRAGADLGLLTPRAAEHFGLPATCRFIVGCLDQYAGAIGVGNIEPGGVSETTGTVLAVVQLADHFSLSAQPGGVFQGPAFRDGFYWRMVFSGVSANYLQAYRDGLPDGPDFEQLIALAEVVEPGAAGLTLETDDGLPCGEVRFRGWSARHTRGHAVRCILETVAAKLAEQVRTLTEGALPPLVHCAGGGARSELWLRIKADALGVPAIAAGVPEPTSLGAAMLAEATLNGIDLRDVFSRRSR